MADTAMISGLPDVLQMAREYALLGSYDTSLLHFQTVLSGIDKFVRTLPSEAGREPWHKAKQDIQTEVNLIKQIVKDLQVFRSQPGANAGAAGPSRGSNARAARHAPADDDVMGAEPPRGLAAHAPPLKGAGGAAAKPKAAPAVSHPASRAAAPPSWEAAPKAGSRSSSASRGSSAAAGAGAGAASGSAARRVSGGAAAGGSYAAASAQGPAKAGGAGGSKASGAPAAKPPIPRQAFPSKDAGRGGGSKAGAAGGKGGKSSAAPGERPKFSEVNHLAVDKDLIEMVENEILEITPNTKFEDIAGLEDAKGLLQEAVVLPMMCPDLFVGIRRPWKGVLLFGPPGTGKTMLAKAVATECGTTFFNVTASTLTSKWRGESERIVRILFEMARYYAPSVVFFDEVDALASSRGGANEHEASRRVKTELLVQMDGISSLVTATDDEEEGGDEDEDAPRASKQVMVLAASNLPWELDDAFRRRFEKRIYIPLPMALDRQSIFSINMRDIQLDPDVDIEALAELTEGYSGADITTLCRTAAMIPIRRALKEGRGAAGKDLAAFREAIKAGKVQSAAKQQVTQADFLEAVGSTKSSVGKVDMKKYAEWMTEFGSA